MQFGTKLEGLNFRILLKRLLEGKEVHHSHHHLFRPSIFPFLFIIFHYVLSLFSSQGPSSGAVKATQYSKDPYEYLAFAVNNLAKFPESRRIVCDPRLELLPQFLPLLSPKATETRQLKRTRNQSRRKGHRGIGYTKERSFIHLSPLVFLGKIGALSVLRNCCMDRELQSEILKPQNKVFAATLCLLTGIPSEIDEEDSEKLLPEVREKLKAVSDFPSNEWMISFLFFE